MIHDNGGQKQVENKIGTADVKTERAYRRSDVRLFRTSGAEIRKGTEAAGRGKRLSEKISAETRGFSLDSDAAS